MSHEHSKEEVVYTGEEVFGGDEDEPNTVTEKVIQQAGKTDQASCDKYKSCDGTVYLQYLILEPLVGASDLRT